jgi:predicted DNA binding CopG/RHH family protein
MNENQIPRFESEEEERRFWATHDATDLIDFSQAQETMMPNLKPSVKTISLRLPEPLLDSIKVLAHKRDIPYQSLIKMLLAEGIEREFHIQEG